MPVLATDELLTVARRVTRDGAARVAHASLTPIAHERIIETTGGLHLARGVVSGGSGEHAWSAVLKVLTRPEDTCLDPGDWCYWRREADFYESAASALAGPLRAPHCYETRATNDRVHIWLEHVTDSSGLWGRDAFFRVARAAGATAGAHVGDVPGLPESCRAPFLRSVLATGGWWATYMDPDVPADVVREVCGGRGAWRSALVSEVFDDEVRARVLRIWAERDHLLGTLDRLPQVLCHNDLHRRNVLLPPALPDEVVALDWAFCAVGAAGGDLADLVWGTLYYGDADVGSVVEHEEAAIAGYLHGLHDAGWTGDPQLIQLGYLVTTALRWAALLPGWVAYLLPADSGFDVPGIFGRPGADVRDTCVALSRLTLERADQARTLTRELRLHPRGATRI